MKYSMTRMLSTLLVLTVSMILNDAHAQYKADTNAIVRIGNQIPLLGGTDQFGRERTFENFKGRNGLVILFYRSARLVPILQGPVAFSPARHSAVQGRHRARGRQLR